MNLIKKNLNKIIIGIVILLATIVVLILFLIEPMSMTSTKISFKINNGESKVQIASNLKDAGLIRSELIALGYLFLSNNVLQAGEYDLNKNMSMTDIFNIINLGATSDTDYITFYEGDKITDYAKTISNFLNISEESVLSTLNDKVYIKELIDSEKYWFLTNDILNDNIYYALEGYLFPDTYNVYINASVYDIIVSMLNNTLTKLEPLKSDFENQSLSIHEVMTLASIIEGETKYDEDRQLVSGVFLNRIEAGWNLGSDVTTFYGAQKEFGTILYVDDYNDCSNSYNTRCTSFTGLSVGPISNPSILSIEAALNPIREDYMYFVADCSGVTHYTKTEAEHIAKTNELKNTNNFCE